VGRRIEAAGGRRLIQAEEERYGRVDAMAYLFTTDDDRQAMLEAIGVTSVEALFDGIPEKLRRHEPLNVPAALTEQELTRHMSLLAAANQHAGNSVCFLGGGSYDHFIPAVVDAIASRSEFYTSYTPYQPEVSQGNLQVMFEYQSLVTRLTGLDVANASLYDGASATAEAVLMAVGATGRKGRVVVSASVHPEYRQTIATYLANLEVPLVTVGATEGTTDLEQLASTVDGGTACVLVQHPSFFGTLEEMHTVSRLARDAGALLVVVFDPISLGILERPGDYGADIAVAEGQCLGNPMAFGGPYLGIMACRRQWIRRMPGRIVGETVDRRGHRCFVLTMQTREQHIRREKATSNICTNQGLLALRATVYLSALGPAGLGEVAQLCLQKSHYAADSLFAGEHFEAAFDKPFFREFVVRDRTGRVERLLTHAARQGYLAGLPLGRWYPELADCFLVSVTEKRTRDEIDTMVSVLSSSAASAPVGLHA
jgi:glycine dehydrogenase subunit 1